MFTTLMTQRLSHQINIPTLRSLMIFLHSNRNPERVILQSGKPGMQDDVLTPEIIQRDPEAAGQKLLNDSRAIVMLMNAESDQSKQAMILRESHFIEDCELLEREVSKLPNVPLELQTVLAE